MRKKMDATSTVNPPFNRLQKYRNTEQNLLVNRFVNNGQSPLVA